MFCFGASSLACLSSLNRLIKKHKLSNRYNTASMLAVVVVVAHANDARGLYTYLVAVNAPTRTW